MRVFVFSSFIMLSMLSNAQQTTAKSACLEKWKNSKTYLTEIAEAMPDSLYDFKPTARQMSFQEQLLHIKSNMEWLGTSYFSDDQLTRSKPKPKLSKAETIALVSAAFETVSKQVKNTSEEKLIETVKFFAGPKSRLQMLNLLQDHVTHHRGQLIVYLNLNGIEPPSYVGW